MRIFLSLLLILFSSNVWSAAPSRTYNYVSHTTIDPVQNNTNENTLYAYLQAGVDTYASGSITNDAISAIAAISYNKLNLLNSINNADISPTAGIVGSKLDLSSPGNIGATSPGTGKFTNLTITGTLNSGVTHQGDIFYDNGSSIVRLVPGTSGQFLKTQGTSANPLWADNNHGIQIFTSSGTFTAPTGITNIIVSEIGGGAGGGSASGGSGNGGGGGSGSYIVGLPYTVTPSSNYTVTIGTAGIAGTAGNDGGNGGTTTFDTVSVLGGSGGIGANTSGNGGAGGVGSSSLYNASSSTATASITGGGFKATGGNGAKQGASDNSGAGGGSPFGAGANGATVAGSQNSATANTGAGGSGGSGFTLPGGQFANGGAGGSGIVIVQY